MKLQLKNGVYYGEVVDGKIHGVGKILFDNGRIYVGQFQNNKYCGYGEYNLPDSSYYKGGWLNGLKHGWGFLKKPEFYFAGQFENGKINGLGYMKLQDETIIIGNWKNGLLYGDNTFYYTNQKSVRKYFNTPGGDVSIFATDDNFDSKLLEERASEIFAQVNNENKLGLSHVVDNILVTKKEPQQQQNVTKTESKASTPNAQTQNEQFKTKKTANLSQEYIDLLEPISDAYVAKNYQLAISLLKKAEKLTDDISQINYCKVFTIMCHAGIAHSEKRYDDSLNLVKKAKSICLNSPVAMTEESKQYLYRHVEGLITTIQLEEMNKACELFNENQNEEPIQKLKQLKKEIINQKLADLCEEKIKSCEIILHQVNQIRDYYDKALTLEENEDYDEAISNYREAKNLSDNDEFIELCDQRIECCKERIIEAKERERERERERELEEQEAKAIEYYNNGLSDYSKGHYLHAMDNFREAYHLTNDVELKRSCIYYYQEAQFTNEDDDEYKP